MAVMERTREIGTLRALGVKRRRIVYLFALESATLGALGSLLGLVLTLLAWLFVKGLQPSWIPPLITKRIPLEVHVVPGYLLWSTVFLILLAALAAVFPARRAAYQTIVDALGHA
jgi:putative ABC transport system permease protein